MKRKFLVKMILVMLTFISLGTLVGCNKEEEIHIDPQYIVNVSKLEYSIKESESGETLSGKTLQAGHEYFLEIDIEYSVGVDTNGDVLIDGLFRLYNVSVIQGSIEEANTAATATQLVFNEDSSEAECQVTSVTFIVPQVANTVKNMLIKVRLTPNFNGSVTAVSSSCKASLVVAMHDTKTKFKIGGNFGDGKTFTVYVKRTNLDKPQATINDVGEITWTHVANATSYDILVNDQVLDTYDASAKMPGETITYFSLISNLTKLGYDSSEYAITVKAKGNTNFIPATSDVIRYNFTSW